MKPAYTSVTTAKSYGYFEDINTLNMVNDMQFESWKAEHEARLEYYKTPEGKAELEREDQKQRARYKREQKFKKHWQWLHDKLASKGCDCDHDGCW